jgi:hypothetical protein
VRSFSRNTRSHNEDVRRSLVQSRNFVRLAGLAAVVGGVMYTALGLLVGFRATLFHVLLGVGAIAAIVALHALQKRRYGLTGAVASVTTFVGMAMIVVSEPVGALGLAMEGSAMILFLLGLLAAFVGMLALGAVTVGARVLPFWCGAALMVGGFGFVVELVGDWIIGASGTEYFNVLVLVTGIPWVVVGYAVFRAGGPRGRKP